jgi:hypothetical protein
MAILARPRREFGKTRVHIATMTMRRLPDEGETFDFPTPPSALHPPSLHKSADVFQVLHSENLFALHGLNDSFVRSGYLRSQAEVVESGTAMRARRAGAR